MNHLKIALVLLFGLSVLSVSCGNSAPSSHSPYLGSSNSPTNPVVSASIGEQAGTVTSASALFYYSGSITTAAVTLVTPGGSLPLTYTSSISAGSTVVSYYYSANTYTYTPGSIYTMTIAYSALTYSQSVTAIGNIAPFTPGTSGVTCTWTGGGNETTITATQTSGGSNSYIYGPSASVTSPYYIAQTALAGYTTGNYLIQLNADEVLTPAFSGFSSASSFTVNNQAQTTY